MVPDLPPEETQILLSWETDPPADVDIYVATINNADDSICVVYFDNRNCPEAAAQQIRLEKNKSFFFDAILTGTMLMVATMDRRLSA